MKRLVGIPVAVAAAAFAGIAIWHWSSTRAIESQLAQFEADAKARKMVKVDVLVSAPPETPADQILYLSGSAPALGNWEAAGVPLEKREDGKHHATIEVMSGIDYGFKVTRGAWNTVERGENGAELPNRTLKVDKDSPLEIAVATWVDGGKVVPNRETRVGDIRPHVKFVSKILGNERTLVVYVPPGYEKSDARYPVLYIQDGQNLFDEATSFAGVEWKLDEAAERLARDGQMEPALLVGIYNSEQRTPEFTPPALGSGSSARGDLYAKFVVEEVKPFIDQRYRTRPARDDTAIGGSAMGGLIALHTAKTYPNVFGRVAVLTPWLRIGDKTLLDSWSGDVVWLKNVRLWLDMGDQPSKNYPNDKPIDDAQAFVKALDAVGIKPGSADFNYTEIQGDGGEHNEAGWSTRVEQVLAFMFPPAATTRPTTASND